MNKKNSAIILILFLVTKIQANNINLSGEWLVKDKETANVFSIDTITLVRYVATEAIKATNYYYIFNFTHDTVLKKYEYGISYNPMLSDAVSVTFNINNIWFR